MNSPQKPEPLIPEGDRATSVLLFDFGGTLDADGVAWKERFFRLCREEGWVVPREQFDPAFYAADDALVGVLPSTLGFRETVERLADGVVRSLGLRDPLLASRIAGRFLQEALKRLAASAALLERLGQRYRLGVVSNFYGNLPAVCRETGVGEYLQVAVDSTMVGRLKPDPRIFFAALAELAAEPCDAVFVGDSLGRDMAGARGVGMPHIWLASEANGGKGRACCPRDRVIHRLEELREIFL